MPELQRGLCLFHPQGHLARPVNPFGKDIANAALFRGLLNHGGFSEVAVLNQLGLNPDQLQSALASKKFVSLTSAPLTDTSWPARFGSVLRGQPYLSELSWLRRNAGLDQAYSLVGLIHTIAPPAVRERIAASAIAPTHSWDTGCTSPAVRRAMEDMFEALAGHFSSRLGASRAPRPQLLSFLSLSERSSWWNRAPINMRVRPSAAFGYQQRRRAGALGWPALVLRESVSPEHVPSHGAGFATESTEDAFPSRWLVPRG